MLEALHPGRIDLGLGRAPGGDMRTAQAMADGAFVDPDRFPAQVQELVGFLDRTLPAAHPFARVRVQPQGETAPEVWLLGSSDYSGALAAHLGLRFAFAHFINAHGSQPVMQAYRSGFRDAGRERTPVSLLCVFVICAETTTQADRLAKSVDLRRLHMAKGIESPVPTLEEAEAYDWSEPERAYVTQQRARLVHGDPDTVREKLLDLARVNDADELMLITITGDYASRRRSYELVAQAFELTS
jgi:luciferase family oxidoreductase group 1